MGMHSHHLTQTVGQVFGQFRESFHGTPVNCSGDTGVKKL
jgi:hypothetical protein